MYLDFLYFKVVPELQVLSNQSLYLPPLLPHCVSTVGELLLGLMDVLRRGGGGGGECDKDVGREEGRKQLV